MSRDEVLDPESVANLRELAGDDAGFLPQMVDLFLHGAAEKLPLLARSLAENRLADVAALCHQLKSSSGNLGALALAAQFERLEEAALQGKTVAAAESFAEVQRCFPAVEAALRTLRG